VDAIDPVVVCSLVAVQQFTRSSIIYYVGLSLIPVVAFWLGELRGADGTRPPQERGTEKKLLIITMVCPTILTTCSIQEHLGVTVLQKFRIDERLNFT